MGSTTGQPHDDAEPPHRGRGRHHHHDHHDHHGHRRSERARRAILNAADDLLVERGFAGVTVEGIAARAGVGKQTIYRWWRSKVDVLMDAFLEDITEEVAPPDTGDLEQDLRRHLANLARFLTRSDSGHVLRALLAESQHTPALATAFRERYLSLQRARDRTILARAIDRGELPPALDVEAALDQLLGPLYYRVLVTGDPVGPAFLDAVVTAFLAAHRQAAPPPKPEPAR